ncbi:MAG TPA: outer membrane protein assembly factor BamB, partial [Burkholderiaceae bacterium]|nr:outer membrane protein assembly factor BamB [Burkholderiaceae bacterium]
GPALAVGEQEGYIHFLSPSDGSLVGRVRIDSSRILAPPQLAAGLMVVQTQDGVVAALSVQP